MPFVMGSVATFEIGDGTWCRSELEKGVKVEVIRKLGIGPDFTNCWISVFPPVKWDQMSLECFLFLIIYHLWNSKALPLPDESPSLPFPRLGFLNYFIHPSSFLFSLLFWNTFQLNCFWQIYDSLNSGPVICQVHIP